MMGWLSGIGFLNPWLLAGLVAVPLLWHLLRLLPPTPRLIDFAPINLLRHLAHPQQTSTTMPVWLLILRILLVTLLLLALAEPVLNPQQSDDRTGPMILILDDGWASGHDWPLRRQLAERWIDRADRSQRLVVLSGTVPHQHSDIAISAKEARQKLAAWQPSPIVPDRAGLRTKLAATNWDHASILWLDDGVNTPEATEFGVFLAETGPLTMRSNQQHLLLRAPTITKDGIEATVARMTQTPSDHQQVRILARDGRLLGEQPVHFGTNDLTTQVRIPLPGPWRNEAARLIIPHHSSAAATWLLDDSLKRRSIALASTSNARQNQPLLTPSFYIEQALSDRNDVTTAPLDQILTQQSAPNPPPLAMIILTENRHPTPTEQAHLATWMDHGGVLVRFAGPQFSDDAENGSTQDPLLPCRLRHHDRQLGGAMSWAKPLPMAAFPAHSPFAGLEVPQDVTISRQLLAEPSVDLPTKSWATLRDGTPLVTADKRGSGWLVLFHVTATPDWSSLPLSGVFIDMLHRLADMGGQDIAPPSSPEHQAQDIILTPQQTINGVGTLTAPDSNARPILFGDSQKWQPSLAHPPGLYAGGPLTRPLNLGAVLPPPEPLTPPLSATLIGANETGERPLKPMLLLVCVMLCLVDWLVSLGLRGYGPGIKRPALIGLMMLVLGPNTSCAEAMDRALILADRPWLGYIRTGDHNADTLSQRGLDHLADVLRTRTAADIQGAVPIDPEQDELAFFPLIYWPMTNNQPPLSDNAVQKINHWLARGGMMIFDTRDEGAQPSGTLGSGVKSLRQLARGIDIPPLQPVTAQHVLSKSFYLLDEFPGRLRGGPLWVEAADSRRHDGVSGVVITSNDFAAAWASNPEQAGLDRETKRQYELALRTGVNLVMYVLTGNYKADQVHIPFILERLGQ